jgi:hypothetical protein
MTNAIHQITSPNSLGSAAAKPKVADRLRQHSVRLYSADGHPLFQYSDKAKTPFDAVEQARAKYDDVLEAIFRARSLTRADVLPKLRAATSEILPGRSANGWRVTSRASSGAANHPRAQHARLGPARVTEIMQSLAMTDRNCIMALQRDYSVSLAMWLSPVGHARDDARHATSRAPETGRTNLTSSQPRARLAAAQVPLALTKPRAARWLRSHRNSCYVLCAS